jgi:hypothetical protein
MSAEFTDLMCAECGHRTEHELRYVGRLLERTRCCECGHEVEHNVDLPHDYAQDLKQRVTSKPARLLRHASDDPWHFVLRLPIQIVRQPVKFAREFWEVFRHR